MKVLSSYPQHKVSKTMTYRELYDRVIENPDYRGMTEKVAEMAQLIYSYGYKADRFVTPDDAIWIALELFEEMTGAYWDITHDELDDLRDKIAG